VSLWILRLYWEELTPRTPSRATWAGTGRGPPVITLAAASAYVGQMTAKQIATIVGD
jgi:hypothetical protein